MHASLHYPQCSKATLEKPLAIGVGIGWRSAGVVTDGVGPRVAAEALSPVYFPPRVETHGAVGWLTGRRAGARGCPALLTKKGSG
ncbi:hypothetical protein PC123_g18250 [Phytophthora cactorum]|nr:hypothetical protein PC123_g18250 [Phytophthora cactorum]